MKHLLLILALASSFCATTHAKIVKGTVTCRNKPISDVIVTDGKHFTLTDKDGSFRFDICPDADFVYIITPSGYAADWSGGVPQFYQKADGRKVFHFDLMKVSENTDRYNIIAVGDPQPRKEEHFAEFAMKPLEDLAQTGSSLEGQVAGIVLGDICFDVFPLMDKWKEEIPRAGFPFYTVAGNHDHDRQIKGDSQAIGGYRERFGPENHAFMIGKDLVILLDNIIYHSYSGYELGYTDEIIGWVTGLMQYIPESADIYVAQHSSANGRHYKGGMIKGYNELLNALKGHQVTFLSGHNHTTGNFEYAQGITEHNIAAICGTWWDVYHCTDGTPRGYKVFTKKGDNLEWYYKSIGRDRSFQYEIYHQGQTTQNPDCIVVNIWDYDSHWSVEWKEDDKEMGAMNQVEEYSPMHESAMKELYAGLGKNIPGYRKTRLSPHYFAARPSSEAKKITIIIKDRFGNCWTETIEL